MGTGQLSIVLKYHTHIKAGDSLRVLFKADGLPTPEQVLAQQPDISLSEY